MLQESYRKQSLKPLPNTDKMTLKQHQALGARLITREIRHGTSQSMKPYAIMCIRMQTYF